MKKQTVRFFTKPGTFINQLQWSTHHWFIMIVFLGLGVVETFATHYHDVYQIAAYFIQDMTGMSFDIALWIVVATKLSLMLAGIFAFTYVIWHVGSLFGNKGSQRVLLRRLATVFSVCLGGYIFQNISPEGTPLFFAGYLLYAWALILGYFSIREQFELNTAEAVVLAIEVILGAK